MGPFRRPRRLCCGGAGSWQADEEIGPAEQLHLSSWHERCSASFPPPMSRQWRMLSSRSLQRLRHLSGDPCLNPRAPRPERRRAVRRAQRLLQRHGEGLASFRCGCPWSNLNVRLCLCIEAVSAKDAQACAMVSHGRCDRDPQLFEIECATTFTLPTQLASCYLHSFAGRLGRAIHLETRARHLHTRPAKLQGTAVEGHTSGLQRGAASLVTLR